MERFMNGDVECIVLARSGDTALIVRPGCTCQPYVVPLQHIKGATDWWNGKYFSELGQAYLYYLSRLGEVAIPADFFKCGASKEDIEEAMRKVMRYNKEVTQYLRDNGEQFS